MKRRSSLFRLYQLTGDPPGNGASLRQLPERLANAAPEVARKRGCPSRVARPEREMSSPEPLPAKSGACDLGFDGCLKVVWKGKAA